MSNQDLIQNKNFKDTSVFTPANLLREARRQKKIKNCTVAVEMEAASLYAFAKASKKNVVCFAHLTNTMAQVKGDFEKGHENGSIDWLNITYHTAKILNKKVK